MLARNHGCRARAARAPAWRWGDVVPSPTAVMPRAGGASSTPQPLDRSLLPRTTGSPGPVFAYRLRRGSERQGAPQL